MAAPAAAGTVGGDGGGSKGVAAPAGGEGGSGCVGGPGCERACSDSVCDWRLPNPWESSMHQRGARRYTRGSPANACCDTAGFGCHVGGAQVHRRCWRGSAKAGTAANAGNTRFDKRNIAD